MLVSILTEGWRKSHNEELHNLSYIPNIIRVIIPRRKRLEGHVARMREMTNSYEPQSENPK